MCACACPRMRVGIIWQPGGVGVALAPMSAPPMARCRVFPAGDPRQVEASLDRLSRPPKNRVARHRAIESPGESESSDFPWHLNLPLSLSLSLTATAPRHDDTAGPRHSLLSVLSAASYSSSSEPRKKVGPIEERDERETRENQAQVSRYTYCSARNIHC